MYLDLFDEIRLNKKLVKIVGFEIAAYWSELQSILKQVVKKQTMDEQGFFTLDREFVERETTLTIAKQLKCEEKLVSLGVIMKDLWISLGKAVVFGGTISLISCSCGYHASGGAKGVGLATTKSVVWSFVAIVIWDMIFAIGFFF